jgi:hypothetical protein
MSLQFSEIEEIKSNNINERKKNRNNRTLKKATSPSDLLKSLNNYDDYEGLESMETDGNDNLASFEQDFSPPQYPEHSDNKKTSTEKSNNDSNKLDKINKIIDLNEPSNEKDLPILNSEKYNKLEQQKAQEYYSKYVPNYYNAANYNEIASESRDKLLEKVNYMIHLLEEQKDEKTDTVTEEVVLYLFLGMFMIFTLDSFCKTAKYTR